MNEENFVHAHQGVVNQVISKDAFKRIVGLLKLSTFARRTIRPTVQDETPIEPEPATSHETSSAQTQARGRKRGRGRGRATGRKIAKTEHVVQPVKQMVTCEISTQTDSDFEGYLEMSEEEFADYQRYKEQQIMQKYLVTTIIQEDFTEYEQA